MENLLRGRMNNKDLISWAKQQLEGKRKEIIWALVVAFALGTVQIIPMIGPIADFLISGAVSLGIAGMALAVVRGEEVKAADVLKGFNNFWPALKTYFFLCLFIVLWFLLFIIPAFFAMLNYSQSFYILKDNPNMGAREILRTSKKMMYGFRTKYFWFIIRWLIIFVLYIAPGLITGGFAYFSWENAKMLFPIAVLISVGGIGVSLYLILFRYYPEWIVSSAAFYEDIREKEVVEEMPKDEINI